MESAWVALLCFAVIAVIGTIIAIELKTVPGRFTVVLRIVGFTAMVTGYLGTGYAVWWLSTR